MEESQTVELQTVSVMHAKKSYTAEGITSVPELRDWVARTLGVPLGGQKLLARGAVLADSTPLPAKVMVVGTACLDTAHLAATLEHAAAEISRFTIATRKEGYLPKSVLADAKGMYSTLTQIYLSPAEPLEPKRADLVKKLATLLSTAK